MAEKKILTYAGLKELEDELQELKVVRRREIAQKLKEARAQGDLSENAEYDAAKDEQRDIETRIEEIEKILKNVEVIDEDEVDLDKINVGCRVELKDLTDKELKDLASRCIKVESDANKVLEKFNNLKQESHNKFREITQSKTKNQGRYNHYLKNLKYGTDLGDFAFYTHPVNFPDDVRTKSGVSIYNMLIHERNRRWKAER